MSKIASCFEKATVHQTVLASGETSNVAERDILSSDTSRQPPAREASRIRQFLLARLHRSQRHLLWNEAVRAEVLKPYPTTEYIGGHVIAYAVAKPIMNAHENQRSLLISKAINTVRQNGKSRDFEDQVDEQTAFDRADDGSARIWLGDRPDLKLLVDENRAALPAADLMLIEMICAAIQLSSLPHEEIVRRLKATDCRISLRLPVHGILPTLVRMTAEGLLSMRGSSSGSTPGWSRDANTLVRFGGQNLRIFDTSDEKDGEDLLRRSEKAIFDGEKILFIGHSTETQPAWVPAMVDIDLKLDDLPVALVAKLIHQITRAEMAECNALLTSAALDLSGLHLADFARAIRADRAPADIISRLHQIAKFRHKLLEERTSESSSGGGRKKSPSIKLEILQPEVLGAEQDQNRVLRVENLAGIGEAGQWAADLKADLELWRDGKIPWDDLSAKALLYGAPGTGKTNFARALRNSLNLPLIVSSVADWLEPGYLGDVLKRMSAVFEKAREVAPCVLFIDEFDGIGKRDSGDGRSFDDYWVSVVNRLLVLLDGALKSEGIIVIGATNRLDKIDPALLRSGRLERHIEITLPGIDDLERIFRHHLGGDAKRFDKGSCVRTPASQPGEINTLRSIAARALGCSGADIEHVVKSARIAARRRGAALAFCDLEEALGQQQPRHSQALMGHFAVHEAGHAIAYKALGLGTILNITVSAAIGGRIAVEFDNDHIQTEAGLMARIVALMSGREAELMVFGKALNGSGGSPSSDLAKASELAIQLETVFGHGGSMPLLYQPHLLDPGGLYLGDQALRARVNSRLEDAAGQAKAIVDKNRDVIERMANVLTDRFELKGPELDALLAEVRREEVASRRLDPMP